MVGKRLGRILLATSLRDGSHRRFRYANFNSFPSLSEDADLTRRLISSYQAIFGDPEAWGEYYTDDEVLQKLTNELAGSAELRICLDGTNHVAGFCWAQVLGVEEIAKAINTIKYYQAIGSPDVVGHLRHRFGDRHLIYLHELGIDARYRGRIPLTQLIYPVLDGLAKRTGIRTVLFWSVADTNISRLAKRALFHRILALDEMRFYSGDLWASTTRPRMFSGERDER